VFHTDGYILFPERDRGSVDTEAGSQYGTADLMDLVQIKPRWTLAASARFDDWRNFDASLFSAPIISPASGTTTPYADQSYQTEP
jgi:hypothetical protein